MGCATSKIEATASVDVYRPKPTSFAVFDINSIEEPWVKADRISESNDEKPTNNMPAPILEQLKTFEHASEAPHSWDEVSKALEDIKPTLHTNTAKSMPSTSPKNAPTPSPAYVSSPPRKIKRKSFSFHTLEELEDKITHKPKPTELRKSESMSQFKKPVLKKPEFKNNESRVEEKTQVVEAVVKPVRENVFIMRDRLEREKEGKEARFDKMRRNPLEDYPEKCPPGGSDSVVLYTTSLRGVRRTFEDCSRVKTILEIHRVVFDERDVSMHGDFLNELKETLGGDNQEEGMISVPRVFVKGRYIGGAEELVELNESGRLGRILNSAKVERGLGRLACEGCGGARFVPCLECGGSCKVVVGDKKERCPKCNENGLAQCPACV